MQHVDEFIEALGHEIRAIRNGRPEASHRLTGGRRTGSFPGGFTYSFRMSSFLIVPDGTPARLEAPRRGDASCEITAVRGLEVELSTGGNLGESIPEATLRCDASYLLEFIREKFAATKDTLFGGYDGMAEAVVRGRSNRVLGLSEDSRRARYSIGRLNESQKRAVMFARQNSLSMIWGPPGTGKTRTVAKLAEAHLAAGRRVLLVSHANTAVDEALCDLAEEAAGSADFRQGKIVRLGHPSRGRLERYPQVSLDTLAAGRARSLAVEKRVLMDERARWEAFLKAAATVGTLRASVYRAVLRLRILKKLIRKIRDKRRKLLKEIRAARTYRTVYREKIRSASQKSKGAVMGLSLEEAAQVERDIGGKIGSFRRTHADLIRRRNRLAAALNLRRKARQTLHQELESLSRAHGIKSNAWEFSARRARLHLSELEAQIRGLGDRVCHIRRKVLKEARLVAATLAKTITSSLLADERFDVLILDEASMAPVPYLYWAAQKASTHVTLAGDFMQLPPICQSDHPLARKWLGRSIFTVLGVTSPEAALKHPLVTLLDTQYRMAPAIAGMAGALFYGNALKTNARSGPSPAGAFAVNTRPLALLDTSLTSSCVVSPPGGSRINEEQARLSVKVCEELMGQSPEEGVGILTPYRAQAELIDSLVRRSHVHGRVRVSTIHRFQGGEMPRIIFDTVDAPGAPGDWSMLNENRPGGWEAKLLLNVAVTRARQSVVVIAHRVFFESRFGSGSVIAGLVRYVSDHGHVLRIMGPDAAKTFGGLRLFE